jgi:hypothetical protein
MRAAVQVSSLALLGVLLSSAQVTPDWRKVGASSVELTFAAAATGPVEQVWFSADGSQLFARTAQGRTFVTSNYETWRPADRGATPPAVVQASATRLPDPNARVVAAASNPERIYALGRQLFRSEDGGYSWINLTQNRSASIVGGGQHALTVSPVDSDQLVLANDFGVWRSADGGLSWAGLNQFLPNLGVRRILSTPAGNTGMRVAADGFGPLELPPGGSVWFPSSDSTLNTEAVRLRQYSATIGEYRACWRRLDAEALPYS